MLCDTLPERTWEEGPIVMFLDPFHLMFSKPLSKSYGNIVINDQLPLELLNVSMKLMVSELWEKLGLRDVLKMFSAEPHIIQGCRYMTTIDSTNWHGKCWHCNFQREMSVKVLPEIIT